MAHKEKSIGECVREAREAKGWSQARLARHIGFSQATLHKIENGISKNSRYIPVIWAQVGLSLDDLNKRLRQSGVVAPESHFVIDGQHRFVGGSMTKRASDNAAFEAGYHGSTNKELLADIVRAICAKLTKPDDELLVEEVTDAVLGTAQELKSGGHGVAIKFERGDGTEFAVLMNTRLAELLCARLDTVVRPAGRVMSDDAT
jgi:DNA-binding XRE family transcriptional regulator